MEIVFNGRTTIVGMMRDSFSIVLEVGGRKVGWTGKNIPRVSPFPLFEFEQFRITIVN